MLLTESRVAGSMLVRSCLIVGPARLKTPLTRLTGAEKEA
jgi:hypothetical protein